MDVVLITASHISQTLWLLLLSEEVELLHHDWVSTAYPDNGYINHFNGWG